MTQMITRVAKATTAGTVNANTMARPSVRMTPFAGRPKVHREVLLAGGQGDNGRAVMNKIVDIFGGLVVMVALTALAAFLGGCTETRYVAVPVPQTAPATPVLQACADHAAVAQREAFGDSFKALQFDASNLVLAAPNQKVGSQAVGAVYDGDGQWFGRPTGTMGEWRAVRFHCLVSPKGNVLYSFLRAE